MKKVFVLLIIVMSCLAFTTVIDPFNGFEPVAIPPSPQRLGGNAENGYEYLTTGDYVKGGLPYSMYVLGLGKDKRNYLGRNGKNQKISHEYTAITAANGEILVAPNCLQCHSQVINDQLWIGQHVNRFYSKQKTQPEKFAEG
jgi:hypothetical protein